MPITSTILSVAARHPLRLAIAGDDERLTYGQLVADARRAFSAIGDLHAHQAAPPRPAPETSGIPITAVSLASPFHTVRIAAALAGYRAIAMVLDPLWPLADRVRAIRAAGAGVVVADDPALADALAEAGWTGALVSWEELRLAERRATPAPPPEPRSADEPFLLLFSSGTTSAPKAFVKTRGQYRANVGVSRAHLGAEPRRVTLAPGTASYSLTLYAAVEALATGGTVHLGETGAAPGILRAERIDRLVAVPAVIRALADAGRRDPRLLRSLGLVVAGGARLPSGLRADLARAAPAARIVEYYGAAEIGFIGGRGEDGLIDPYEGVEVRVHDDAGAVVHDGALGTVWVRAASCSAGYLAGAAAAPIDAAGEARAGDAAGAGADSEVRVGDAAGAARGVSADADGGARPIDVAGASGTALRDADGWATVGDVGRMHAGRLELVGRAGDVVATGGHKVSLAEVERAFDGVSGVGAACAIAEPHDALGSVIALVIEGAAPADALRAHARAGLAPQFAPRRWYRVAALPRTVGGKIRRGATAELVAAGGAERL
ncbi:class I adenylate-forming enzyme family protein [Microbacterium karelineae]|uniref:class I adenylate-forming enzyme family protein n=1 Tax=Microbacterium karelineae TaxID=2654283 RepID=UPI0012E9C614|nr:AMP-binding protein [Microbacterium karelineae]